MLFLSDWNAPVFFQPVLEDPLRVPGPGESLREEERRGTEFAARVSRPRNEPQRSGIDDGLKKRLK